MWQRLWLRGPLPLSGWAPGDQLDSHTQSPSGELDSDGGCLETCFEHWAAPTSLKRGNVSPVTTPHASPWKAGPVRQAHPPGTCPSGAFTLSPARFGEFSISMLCQTAGPWGAGGACLTH